MNIQRAHPWTAYQKDVPFRVRFKNTIVSVYPHRWKIPGKMHTGTGYGIQYRFSHFSVITANKTLQRILGRFV